MGWYASYELIEAAFFFGVFVVLAVFSRYRPDSATSLLNVAIPSSLLLSITFAAAHYLGERLERAEVAGALAKELPFLVILSVLCVVQAEFLQGALEDRSVRRILYTAPRVLAAAWVLALIFGLLWPSNALATFAPAHIEFVVFKVTLLFPEFLFSGLVSLLFLADLSPRSMSHYLSPIRETGERALQGLRPWPLTAKLRLKSLGFFFGTLCWTLLSVNAMAVAFVRWMAPTGAREALVDVATFLNSALIFLSLAALLSGLGILIFQSREECLTEKVIRWFALTDRIELRMWGFSGEKARPTFSQKYYISRAGERLGMPQEEKESAFRALKIAGLCESGEVDRQQLKRLEWLHASLSRTPAVPGLINKQVEIVGDSGSHYDFSEDPMQDCLRTVLYLMDSSNDSPIAEPRWIQLAAVSAAHVGYLPDKRADAIFQGTVVEREVLNSFTEAVDDAERHKVCESSRARSNPA